MLLGKYINKYYIKYALPLLFGIATLIAVDYIQLITPELYRMLINGINNGVVKIGEEVFVFDTAFLLDHICMPMIWIIIALAIGRFLWRISFIGTSYRVEANMRAEMFDRCKDLSQHYYHKNKVGNLMSLFTNDLETVQDCVAFGVLMTADSLFLGILAISKMARMNLTLTLCSMIPMVFLLIGAIILGHYMKIKWDLRQQAYSDLSDFSHDSFSGISVIKAFVKEGKELAAFSLLNKKNEKANVDYTKLSVGFNVSVSLFVESVVCIILGYGGYLAHEGVFNGGELVEFIAYFNAVIWPVMAVSELVEKTSRGNASLSRIGALLDEVPDVTDKEGAVDIEQVYGDIEFRELNFRYEGRDCDVLKNINLKINAGENVGIIGGTGSGKTTIADLLVRIHNVDDGKLFIDGRDVNSLTISSLRAHIAYVPQDNFLFSDTIENNILFAADDIDHDEVRRVCELSDVDSNIEDFSDKYETVLGERGVTLSGGQKQRISIARALAKNAEILILDDSVSAVDVKTEKKILENLRKERVGKTTILIAHRVSSVEKMDKVIYMENGAIIDCGSHDELFKRCEGYRKEVMLQRLDESNKESVS